MNLCIVISKHFVVELNSREERSQQYFETVDLNAGSEYTGEMDDPYDRVRRNLPIRKSKGRSI